MNADESRPRRPTRAETKARTRAVLLDAAAQVFARKGFAGASVDDIAEAAGFSKGALYSNFASKDELFIELLSSRNRDRVAESAAIVADQSNSVEDARSAINQLLVEVADNDVDMATLQAEFWLYAIRRPEFRGHLAAQFRSNRDALATMLTHRAANRSRAGSQSFDELATLLLALFQGLVQLRRTDPDLVPESLYGTAAGWLFTGMNATTGERK